MTLPAPKHYWNFNEISGTTAADSAGGQVISLDRADWVPGKQGNAIRFNPKDGVRLATTSLPEMPPPWTVGFWVMREADSDGAALFSSVDFALKLEQWENTHQVGFSKFSHFENNYQGFDTPFDYTIPLKQWVHLTLVGTTDAVMLYVNGKRMGSLRSEDPIKLGLRWLGSTRGFTELASAILDEIQVFDQALTDAQVGELAGAELEVDFTTGKADWQLQSVPPGSSLTRGPTPVVTAYPGWTVPLEGGAQWLGDTRGDAAVGEYIYELPFRVDADFSKVDGQLTVRADEYATIWLNDTQIGELPQGSTSWLNGSSGAVVQFASFSNILRSGGNKLKVIVTNPAHPGTNIDTSGNPTGLLVSGSLKVK